MPRRSPAGALPLAAAAPVRAVGEEALTPPEDSSGGDAAADAAGFCAAPLGAIQSVEADPATASRRFAGGGLPALRGADGDRAVSLGLSPPMQATDSGQHPSGGVLTRLSDTAAPDNPGACRPPPGVF